MLKPKTEINTLLAVVVPTEIFQVWENARGLALHERGVCEVPAGAMQLCEHPAQLPLMYQVYR